jgi:hypothetical protein
MFLNFFNRLSNPWPKNMRLLNDTFVRTAIGTLLA